MAKVPPAGSNATTVEKSSSIASPTQASKLSGTPLETPSEKPLKPALKADYIQAVGDLQATIKNTKGIPQSTLRNLTPQPYKYKETSPKFASVKAPEAGDSILSIASLPNVAPSSKVATGPKDTKGAPLGVKFSGHAARERAPSADVQLSLLASKTVDQVKPEADPRLFDLANQLTLPTNKQSSVTTESQDSTFADSTISSIPTVVKFQGVPETVRKLLPETSFGLATVSGPTDRSVPSASGHLSRHSVGFAQPPVTKVAEPSADFLANTVTAKSEKAPISDTKPITAKTDTEPKKPLADPLAAKTDLESRKSGATLVPAKSDPEPRKAGPTSVPAKSDPEPRKAGRTSVPAKSDPEPRKTGPTSVPAKSDPEPKKSGAISVANKSDPEPRKSGPTSVPAKSDPEPGKSGATLVSDKPDPESRNSKPTSVPAKSDPEPRKYGTTSVSAKLNFESSKHTTSPRSRRFNSGKDRKRVGIASHPEQADIDDFLSMHDNFRGAEARFEKSSSGVPHRKSYPGSRKSGHSSLRSDHIDLDSSASADSEDSSGLHCSSQPVITSPHFTPSSNRRPSLGVPLSKGEQKKPTKQFLFVSGKDRRRDSEQAKFSSVAATKGSKTDKSSRSQQEDASNNTRTHSEKQIDCSTEGDHCKVQDKGVYEVETDCRHTPDVKNSSADCGDKMHKSELEKCSPNDCDKAPMSGLGHFFHQHSGYCRTRNAAYEAIMPTVYPITAGSTDASLSASQWQPDYVSAADSYRLYSQRPSSFQSHGPYRSSDPYYPGFSDHPVYSRPSSPRPIPRYPRPNSPVSDPYYSGFSGHPGYSRPGSPYPRPRYPRPSSPNQRPVCPRHCSPCPRPIRLGPPPSFPPSSPPLPWSPSLPPMYTAPPHYSIRPSHPPNYSYSQTVATYPCRDYSDPEYDPNGCKQQVKPASFDIPDNFKSIPNLPQQFLVDSYLRNAAAATATAAQIYSGSAGSNSGSPVPLSEVIRGASPIAASGALRHVAPEEIRRNISITLRPTSELQRILDYRRQMECEFESDEDCCVEYPDEYRKIQHRRGFG